MSTDLYMGVRLCVAHFPAPNLPGARGGHSILEILCRHVSVGHCSVHVFRSPWRRAAPIGYGLALTLVRLSVVKK